MNIQEVILIFVPNYKFESHIKFLKGEVLEEQLMLVLLNIRQKMFNVGNWDGDKEKLVKSVIKDEKFYNAYNKVNCSRFPQDLSLTHYFFAKPQIRK